MKTIPMNATNGETFPRIWRTAQHGTFDGLNPDDPYLQQCRWWLERFECIVIFTRDVGYHTSGWWKNPDYERCYHLSISFPGGMKRSRLEYVIKQLFGDDRRWLWSFLNLCTREDGTQWTGSHATMEQLVCLGVGAGKMKYLLPRSMWNILPGGMPYLAVLEKNL